MEVTGKMSKEGLNRKMNVQEIILNMEELARWCTIIEKREHWWCNYRSRRNVRGRRAANCNVTMKIFKSKIGRI